MAAATLSFWHNEKFRVRRQPPFSTKRRPNQATPKDFARWHDCCDWKWKMKKLNDKSVLIVDDDTRMLRALDKVLTGEGASVTKAQWAGDALDFLTERQTRIDLVITDLRMPLVSGMTVVYAIHKIFPALPIIVLTAFGSPDVKDECLRQGAAAFLEKPLNTAELLEVIEKMFASRPAGTEHTTPGGDEKTAERVAQNARRQGRGMTAGVGGV
jgi:DNA-binding NtrC family response regulator